jgi:hypothetical protein
MKSLAIDCIKFTLGELLMGATPWWYVVDYIPDINYVLQNLRQQEFQAGRYYPAISYEFFPITPEYTNPFPGAQHDSIEDAITDADADGTQSILDIREVSNDRSPGTTSPLESLELLHVFGTEFPNIDDIGDIDEENFPDEIFDFIDRGESVYVLLYKDSVPKKILFVGYSYD